MILITFIGIAAIFHTYSSQREEEAGGRYAGFMLNEMVYSINERLLMVENVVKRYEPIVEKTLSTPDSLMALVEEWTLSDSLVIGGSICFEPYYYSKKRGILHALRHHDAR